MNETIFEYIPQRPPFIMVDEVTHADGPATTTSFKITADNVLVKNGYFTESGLLENMAQTAGAGTGYNAKKAGKPTPAGYFAAIKNIRVLELPKVNDTITSEIVVHQQLLSFHIATGKVLLNGREIASCAFIIFLMPDPPAKA